MIAFPCTTFSVTRFFDASAQGLGDSGPPILRTKSHPDGLPEDQIDPKHVRELRASNLLLERTVQIAIAARRSPARTTIVFENPADRSIRDTACYSPLFKEHGSAFATSPFKRLIAAADMASNSTFAYCRLNAPYQKYTTIYYTPEAGSVLDALNGPEFKCNHERGAHAQQAGGRGPDGEFVSGRAASYPAMLNAILARAFTIARTGHWIASGSPSREASGPEQQTHREAAPQESARHPVPPASPHDDLWEHGAPSDARWENTSNASPQRDPAPSGSPQARHDSSPIEFPSLDTNASLAPPASGPSVAARLPTELRAQASAVKNAGYKSSLQPLHELPPRRAGSKAAAAERFDPSPDFSPGGTSADGYEPFSPAMVMEEAVANLAFDSAALHHPYSPDVTVTPVSPWRVISAPPGKQAGMHALSFQVAVDADDAASPASMVAGIHAALRADSPDAPSTHDEAMRRGDVWVRAEGKELDNHSKNKSWTCVPRSQVPHGRRIHKLIWVYKVKRDGTCKARLCVQGTTLEKGIDFDQVFSAALRYSSARALFAYAAKCGCNVRSVDLVAAYLQGEFIDGEVVYCHLPPGHPKLGPDGQPYIARVDKPIYGIQQAGRRLQRRLFSWLEKQGFKSLDDSDPCVFTREHANGEIIKMGVYVDNLQIVHSVSLDASGRGPDGCAYNDFYDKLSTDWDVVDEGPMEDLLGIEIDNLPDGSIKLHQTKYIRKMVDRFLPDGVPSHVQKNSMPYSAAFTARINDALSVDPGAYPGILTEFQERVGCLMYAATSSRCDIAYPVHQLCKCLQRPTPDLIRETDHLFAYLARTASLGLTYSRESSGLEAFADASWEERFSTSGWFVRWQSAALCWGSRKQKCVALSTCEAEIIALSEAAKDVVYIRRLLSGIDAPIKSPTPLSSDSKSARDVSYNPEHHDRMKHVARRHYFVRDMVEALELEVPFVRTDDNAADFFTKPMPNANKFCGFRNKIMNITTDEFTGTAKFSRVTERPTFGRGGASEGSAVARPARAH